MNQFKFKDLNHLDRLIKNQIKKEIKSFTCRFLPSLQVIKNLIILKIFRINNLKH